MTLPRICSLNKFDYLDHPNSLCKPRHLQQQILLREDQLAIFLIFSSDLRNFLLEWHNGPQPPAAYASEQDYTSRNIKKKNCSEFYKQFFLVYFSFSILHLIYHSDLIYDTNILCQTLLLIYM